MVSSALDKPPGRSINPAEYKVIKVTKEKRLKPFEFIEVKTAFRANSDNYVDARRVHGWLGVKTSFTRWIKRRIEKYGFENGLDFIIALPDAKNGKALNGNDFSSMHYLCSPDMVKQLAMVESTDKGKQVRKYYIDLAEYVQDGIELQRQMDKLYFEDKQTLSDASSGSHAMLRRKEFLRDAEERRIELIKKTQIDLFAA